MSEAVKRAWRLMREWKACLFCNTSFLLWQDCQWDWIYIRGQTSDAMMSTPSHTPFPQNTGVRPDKSTHVITKLREKDQLPPRILSGDGDLENTVSESLWPASWLSPVWRTGQESNCHWKRVNGPKWWAHKLFPFQCVHYCGEDGYLECRLVCIHQSYSFYATLEKIICHV